MTNNEAAKWIQLYIGLAKIDPLTGEAAYLNDDDKKTIEAMEMAINALTAQPELTDVQAIEHLQESGWMQNHDKQMYEMGLREQLADDSDSYDALLPSAQPEQRYTEEELRIFQHGISLSLLSKRSAQHWQYDEDTATEIKFLERLYEKVGADIRGEEV